MNYRKRQITTQANQLLEERYFKNKFLNESTNFTMLDKKIIKTVDGKPVDLTPEEQEETKELDKTSDDPKILAAIEKLNQKFGKL
jgi:DNA-directed RNA polymerase specialized sigma subunit